PLRGDMVGETVLFYRYMVSTEPGLEKDIKKTFFSLKKDCIIAYHQPCHHMKPFRNNSIPVLLCAAISLLITSCAQTTHTNKKMAQGTLKAAAAVAAPAPAPVADST